MVVVHNSNKSLCPLITSHLNAVEWDPSDLHKTNNDSLVDTKTNTHINIQ